MADIDLIAGADSPFDPWVRDAVRQQRDELHALREGIRALADEWEKNETVWPRSVRRLRALLAPPPAATTGEADDEDLNVTFDRMPKSSEVVATFKLPAPVSSGEAGTGEAVGVAYLTVNQWCDDCGYHRSNGHQAECPHADPARLVTPSAEGAPSIGDTCCGKCPGGTCYVDHVTGA